MLNVWKYETKIGADIDLNDCIELLVNTIHFKLNFTAFYIFILFRKYMYDYIDISILLLLLAFTVFFTSLLCLANWLMYAIWSSLMASRFANRLDWGLSWLDSQNVHLEGSKFKLF